MNAVPFGDIAGEAGEAAPAVRGVRDNLSMRLFELAEEGGRNSAASLRNVLPQEEAIRGSVCAFGSSI